MVAEVWIWEVRGPAIENFCQRSSLSAARGQVPFQHENQDYVPLSRKIGHILRDHNPAFRTGSRSDLRVIDRSAAHFGDVDCIPPMGSAQELGGGQREHLIDQEGRHARSFSRCSVIMRLRLVINRLRSIRRRTSSACSAA